jgi:hypothetical protein
MRSKKKEKNPLMAMVAHASLQPALPGYRLIYNLKLILNVQFFDFFWLSAR